RFAARSLARTPGLTTVAILTLAFGIGANSAVFSLVNAVILRPLPFAEPDRLAAIFERRDGADHLTVSGHEYVAWRDQTHAFDGITMYGNLGFTLTGRGDPVTVSAQSVATNFFDVLGVRPLLGRGFRPSDDQENGARVAIIGRSLWETRFGRDSNIVGKRLMLDDSPFEIV